MIRTVTSGTGKARFICPACSLSHDTEIAAKSCCGWKGGRPDAAKPAANQKQVGGDHYATRSIQPWDAMQAWGTESEFVGFLRFNAIKYLARAGSKGPACEDYAKARHYIDKLLEVLGE